MDTNGHTILSEDYVSYEVAKLLKDKGFDGLCYCHEFTDYEGNFTTYHTEYQENWNQSEPCVSIPTLGMAMKWLREEKNILIYVYPVINLPVKDDYTFYWRWDGKKKIHNAPPIGNKHNYESYEETVEAALKYCLENLI